MQRGVVILQKQEIENALRILNQSSSDGLELIIQKLESAQNDPSHEVNLGLSEEEVELLMDQLPPPGLQQNNDINTLRVKLSEFLNQLRA